MSLKIIYYNFYMTKFPSGRQVLIEYGDQTAVITEMGATLRLYDIGGKPVIWGFGHDSISGHSQGQLLAPWPNRLEDGIYSFDGQKFQVPINEQKNHNAIHGMFNWQRFQIDDITGNGCRLSFDHLPIPGYPYHLSLTVEYTLSDTGLEVSAFAVNTGQKRLPFALGFHPYLASDGGSIDKCKLLMPARKRLLMNDRKIPIGEEIIVDTDLDFSYKSKSRYIEDLLMDDCFFDLDLDEESMCNIIFENPSERQVLLWADHNFSYIMCYTADNLGDDSRRALAIEPMTSPPNAFASGKDLIILNPGENWHARFGINPFING